ncbi:hypothetical protein TNCV_2081471 [Trichonephila clavipes]|nr:hypothetical protein TNCV_2081471 [Trichonephila clavipes]
MWTTSKRRAQELVNLKMSPPSSIQCDRIIKRPSGCGSKEGISSRGGSATAVTATNHTGRSPYSICRAGSRKDRGEESMTKRTWRELRTRPYNLSSRTDTRKSGFSSPEQRQFIWDCWKQRVSQRTPSLELERSNSSWIS